MQRILKVLALVCLILAVAVGLGVLTAVHEDVLVPLGLAFWCGSEV